MTTQLTEPSTIDQRDEATATTATDTFTHFD